MKSTSDKVLLPSRLHFLEVLLQCILGNISPSAEVGFALIKLYFIHTYLT